MILEYTHIHTHTHTTHGPVHPLLPLARYGVYMCAVGSRPSFLTVQRMASSCPHAPKARNSHTFSLFPFTHHHPLPYPQPRPPRLPAATAPPTLHLRHASSTMVGSYFSAVCWFTLKRVFDAVRASTGEQVPLGGIDQSYGGTSIQYWMSPDAIKASQAPIATQVM